MLFNNALPLVINQEKKMGAPKFYLERNDGNIGRFGDNSYTEMHINQTNPTSDKTENTAQSIFQQNQFSNHSGTRNIQSYQWVDRIERPGNVNNEGLVATIGNNNRAEFNRQSDSSNADGALFATIVALTSTARVDTFLQIIETALQIQFPVMKTKKLKQHAKDIFYKMNQMQMVPGNSNCNNGAIAAVLMYFVKEIVF
jgi:hypothetical protein